LIRSGINEAVEFKIAGGFGTEELPLRKTDRWFPMIALL
jgi:hypothetical protein